MSDVVVQPAIHVERCPDDGGKAERARRELIGLARQGGPIIP